MLHKCRTVGLTAFVKDCRMELEGECFSFLLKHYGILYEMLLVQNIDGLLFLYELM